MDVAYGSHTFRNVRLGSEYHINRAFYDSDTSIMRIGQRTGITNGRLTHRDTFVLGGGMVADGIMYSNLGQSGDSGGPVFFNRGGTLYLIGMHVGGPAATRMSM